MRVADVLVHAGGLLSAKGIPDARIEAEVLLRHALGTDRAGLYANLNEPLTPQQRGGVSQLLQRRLEGEPLAYIVGHREFYGLDFAVNPDVLVPRQETELLVDKVLEYASTSRPGESLEIADVGTGSGAVAIAIARHLPQATLYALDLRREALMIADMNRRRHGLSGRVHLCQADLLEALGRPVDVIVSNPPYLSAAEMARLPAEVRREPVSALDGGADGLVITLRLLRQASKHVRTRGCILVEISPEQLEPVSRLMRAVLPGAQVSFARDALGLPRVVMGDLVSCLLNSMN